MADSKQFAGFRFPDKGSRVLAEWNAQRAHARQVASMQSRARGAWSAGRRSFASAESNNLTHNWSTTDYHVNQLLLRSLRTLRARSRDLKRNNDYARQFLRMVKTNVVGPNGFGLQVHAKKRDGSIDTPDSNRCEQAFAKWSKREHCDFLGQLSFVEFCNLYMETLATDGEVLVRRVRGSGLFGYQLQLLDPAMLDERYNVDLPGGRRIRMGVELDADGRPVAYYLTRHPIADPRMFVNATADFVRVPASEIWHDFIVEQAGQLRGIPWMCTSIIRQHRLAAYETAALAAAEEGAKKLAWIGTPEGEMKSLADAFDLDDGSINSGTLHSDSGGIHYAQLPQGFDLQSWDPKYPEQSFGDFVKAQLRGIAAGLGVNYHDLANDLEGVNFSSSRVGVLEVREVWKGLQRFAIDRLAARVYSEWLPLTILTGQLNLPMDKLEKFDAAVWQGRRWAWVDPSKDVKANIDAIDNGLTSRTRVIRDMGQDPEEIWAELAKEKELLGELIRPKQAAAPVAAPDDEQDDDETDDTKED